MNFTLQDLSKDITKIDQPDILECWLWSLHDIKRIVIVTLLGDLFVEANDNSIYWLQTDSGDLNKVADNIQQFQELLNDESNLDNWFLPLLIEKLLIAGKTLKENEVYSYLKLPAIGGEYSIDNIKSTDIAVHFAFSGQICEQIKDLPDGTKVNIKYESYKPDGI